MLEAIGSAFRACYPSTHRFRFCSSPVLLLFVPLPVFLLVLLSVLLLMFLAVLCCHCPRGMWVSLSERLSGPWEGDKKQKSDGSGCRIDRAACQWLMQQHGGTSKKTKSRITAVHFSLPLSPPIHPLPTSPPLWRCRPLISVHGYR